MFDLETLQWRRLSDPAQPDRERTDQYGDGTPRSRHTYDYIEFVPAVNRLISFGGAALYPYGNTATRRISEFDPAARSWVTGRRTDLPGGGNMIEHFLEPSFTAHHVEEADDESGAEHVATGAAEGEEENAM